MKKEYINLDFAFEWWLFTIDGFWRMKLPFPDFGKFCDKIKKAGFIIE